MDPIVALIVLFVFLGALTQRTTGMGFALVAGPFLVVLLEPAAGVVLVNACGVLASLFVLSRTYKEVRWKRAAILAVGAVIGIIPGALLVTTMPTWAVRIFIGALIIAALLVSLFSSRFLQPMRPAPVRSAVTGFVSGFMSGSAGVGGPALSVYAIMTRWEQRSFAATLQPYFVFTGLAAITAKVLFDRSAVPVLPWWIWAAIAVSMVLGQVAGELLANRLPVRAARTGMIVLAFGGGLLTLITGVTGRL